jgi:hypothetical protein
MTTRIQPFSNGSDFADWTESNCEQCIVGDGDCALGQALGLAYLTDGKIARHAAVLIGCDGIWPKPCTLRHHKNDASKTRADVQARIDAALNTEIA